MANPIFTLRDAIKDYLIAHQRDAQARYIHYEKPSEVENGKWIVALNADNANSFRNVDVRDFTIDLVYQRGLPKASKEHQDPLDNLPFLDACVNERTAIADLFGEEGELRGQPIADCVAIEVLETPLYQVDFLIRMFIFTSVVRVRFRYEG